MVASWRRRSVDAQSLVERIHYNVRNARDHHHHHQRDLSMLNELDVLGAYDDESPTGICVGRCP